MSVTQATTDPTPRTDERVRRVSFLRKMLVRPEMGAIGGSIAVWAFFAIIAGDSGFLSLAGSANYLTVAAELGIIAVPVALLMIGGEFDLSIGSIIGASGMVMTILAVQYRWNIWAAIAVAMLLALLVGFLNGYLVLRTGLPSFIVTLGTQFVLRGATIGITRGLTGLTQIGGLTETGGFNLAQTIFGSNITIGDGHFPISIVWWLAITTLATWVLLRTSFGNWIFGVGGDAQAARNVGVPVSRVKILLFMGTAFAGCLLAVIQGIGATGADVLRGQTQEFLAIIAVVIGGTLLTGGYGSAIGSAFGALIYGIVGQGIFFVGVDADWNSVVLGFMLLLAVLLNSYVRKYAMEVRR
jgi:simple sugar transport system permease protein